ncbi:type VI secretion system tube protein TssD [Chryseobacterium sp. SL1]|uniref:type VI secretion system tube protein TssD n=1 Tax=Chryseobacterium sp. SL1 TaxID=2995159 RepID=UPI0022736215|nr:type VI secretion system tube protein TssD [Chryseobacterium sp. SL1]MCY1660175.1 type VI secretion system tube protein TssD [Chryseobacterium sp. SL1]
MSFLTKLELDGNVYNVLECGYKFIQPTDGTGKPQGMPQGGEISIRIESTGNTELLGWMLDHNKTKDGKIIFYRRDAMSKLQELNFEKAYCIEFAEYFNSSNNEPLQIELKFTAKKFDINGATYEKKWR